MTATLITMLLMPSAVGQSVVEQDVAQISASLSSDRDAALYEQAWNQLQRQQDEREVVPFRSGPLYAAQLPRKEDRNAREAAPEKPGIDRKKAVEPQNADSQAKPDVKKPQPVRDKVAPQMGDPVNAPTSKQIFRRAYGVWGGEDRMWRMLSGISYDDNDAQRDGVQPKPYVSSLGDYEAVQNQPKTVWDKEKEDAKAKRTADSSRSNRK